jgi:hypothetical protein
MTFNIFTSQRVSCFGQYYRIDDLITFKLRGDKRPVRGQFLVDEFHSSAVFKCFDRKRPDLTVEQPGLLGRGNDAVI